MIALDARYRPFTRTAAAFTITLALAACSQAPAPPPQPSAAEQAAARDAAAQKEFQLYQQMLDKGHDILAAPVGEEIVRKYPGTSAAAEVQKTLPGIQAAIQAAAEKKRLAGLWYYQSGNVQGKQHTATIYASGPLASQAGRVRLVLRRHAEWGLSTYLFAPDGSKGFVCKGNCNIVMHVDGKREVWKGYLPPSGEPAMFIKGEKRFIDMLEKAKVITMDVTLRGRGTKTIKFEVGGYDPAKFKPLS